MVSSYRLWYFGKGALHHRQKYWLKWKGRCSKSNSCNTRKREEEDVIQKNLGESCTKCNTCNTITYTLYQCILKKTRPQRKLLIFLIIRLCWNLLSLDDAMMEVLDMWTFSCFFSLNHLLHLSYFKCSNYYIYLLQINCSLSKNRGYN